MRRPPHQPTLQTICTALVIVSSMLYLGGCGTTPSDTDADGKTSDAATDTGAAADTGATTDTGAPVDAASADVPTSGDSSGDSSGDNTGDTATTIKPVSLLKEVLPLLKKQCGYCHSPVGQPPAIVNKLFYNTKADILAGKGKGITPGSSAASSLIKILKQKFGVGKNMTLMPPPKSGRPKMADDDIALIARWIDEGAKDN